MHLSRLSWLPALLLLAAPAEAVMRGTVSRDPAGVRQSVVQVESSLGELCSGVLIAADLVLTAAHCVTEDAAYRITGVDRAFRSRAVRAVAVAVHPAFVRGTTPRTQPGVDLAVLKLEHRLGADFAPLDPGLASAVAQGQTVLLAGFGVLEEGRRRTARTLRQTSLVALGPMQVRNRVLIVADQDRRAGALGAGACRGDSGGPILARSAAGYQVLGIVSWSSGALDARQDTACGGLTAVTPVAEHAQWIVQSSANLARLPVAAGPRRRAPPAGDARWTNR
jgi:secreted trypsin-like serine protease